MVVILHGDLRRFGERLEVEAKTPKEALEKLCIPLEEAWLLAVGERMVGLDEEVEGPLEVFPPIAGGGILRVLPHGAGGAKGGEPPYAHPA
nr:hypothetical protein [Thermus sediminis]